jgi:phospholipase C
MATSSLGKIEHVVVLMLENRSFDSMLGRLYPKSDAFDGLSGSECNPGPDGQPVFVNNVPGATPEILSNADGLVTFDNGRFRKKLPEQGG